MNTITISNTEIIEMLAKNMIKDTKHDEHEEILPAVLQAVIDDHLEDDVKTDERTYTFITGFENGRDGCDVIAIVAVINDARDTFRGWKFTYSESIPTSAGGRYSVNFGSLSAEQTLEVYYNRRV